MDQFAEIIENGLALLVRYSEDLWNTYSPERQEAFKVHWRELATEKKFTVVALQLIPDELFPTGINEKPYIAWQERLGVQEKNPYSISSHIVVKMDNFDKTIPVEVRNAMGKELRERYAIGSNYIIVDASGEVLSAGKV